MDTFQFPFSPESWPPQFPFNAISQSWFKDFFQYTSGTNGKGTSISFDPLLVAKLQSEYFYEAVRLWQDMLAAKPPTLKDRRFHSPAWSENAFHAFNVAMYLLNSRFMLGLAEAVQTDPKTKQKIVFATQQIIDAVSPSNFLATNPAAQQKFLETEGQSLSKGMAHLLADAQKGWISQTDESAFEVGRNIAMTEGAVVFENELFQLIQYKPLTETVYQRPLLIVPPCINKYYILDLQPNNSMVRYALDNGHRIFLISWRNPDDSMANLTWDDYIKSGVLKAIEIVQEISRQEQINTLGFCVGGTMLAMALALLFASGKKPVASLTLLTTLLDYSDAGALEVYIDELQVRARETAIGNAGLMSGREFALAFSSLRPHDLIWQYVESNYLKGESPPAFDLLFWNSDSTNLPGPMFCWYLRNLYLENRLKDAGALSIDGEKIDLAKINAPTFVYASREDHIVPWTSAYASAELINTKKPAQNRFVLGASGHIAGVINPPAKRKRSYWINTTKPANAQSWFEQATEHEGSWWPDWMAFLAKYAGAQIKAPSKYGNAKYKTIEPAPGRYVKAKATG
ncbi:class I poly(R)-hydroxyalkanoic acid synthase [Oxalobacteraceae bacterium R-40]|uniref:Class I poly(R)-hydroxyalkanoic acid synthase n=1 Tax=Keguizhuia sedimenti TaxID=3064264 RepID=A0ABU1BNN8_9BURK|nr:class I poly(R)-hydroxyalkanoic acid synthase [Oxalobacteraceae bacterium R-40]